jgi:hypothetical protein
MRDDYVNRSGLFAMGTPTLHAAEVSAIEWFDLVSPAAYDEPFDVLDSCGDAAVWLLTGVF